MAQIVAVARINIYDDGTSDSSITYYTDGAHAGTKDMPVPDGAVEAISEHAPEGHVLAAPEPVPDEAEAAVDSTEDEDGEPEKTEADETVTRTVG